MPAAVVRRERLTQPLDGPCRLALAQAGEGVAAINATVPEANITLPEGRHPDRPADNYLDTTRLRADTGFRPEYDVERAVPDYADWLRRHDR